MRFGLRLAMPEDVSALNDLIRLSARQLQKSDYSNEQIEAALQGIFGVDSQLIADATYFAATPNDNWQLILGCGGWSWRKTLFGCDGWSGREACVLDPRRDAAKIRAFFVHPDWSRHGIASLILEACEYAAVKAGFTRLELGATLTGLRFYEKRGYIERSRAEVPVGNGLRVCVVHMDKTSQSRQI